MGAQHHHAEAASGEVLATRYHLLRRLYRDDSLLLYAPGCLEIRLASSFVVILGLVYLGATADRSRLRHLGLRALPDAGIRTASFLYPDSIVATITAWVFLRGSSAGNVSSGRSACIGGSRHRECASGYLIVRRTLMREIAIPTAIR